MLLRSDTAHGRTYESNCGDRQRRRDQALSAAAAAHARPSLLALGPRDRAQLSSFFSLRKEDAGEGQSEGKGLIGGKAGEDKGGPGGGVDQEAERGRAGVPRRVGMLHSCSGLLRARVRCT